MVTGRGGEVKAALDEVGSGLKPRYLSVAGIGVGVESGGGGMVKLREALGGTSSRLFHIACMAKLQIPKTWDNVNWRRTRSSPPHREITALPGRAARPG